MKPAPRGDRRRTQHRLVPVRIVGSGKQLVWKCMHAKCVYVDNGGHMSVTGCPKLPPPPR